MTEQLQAVPSSSEPTGPRPASALRGLAGGIVGGVAVVLLTAAGGVALWPQIQVRLNDAEQPRLDALATRLASLDQRLTAVENRPTPAAEARADTPTAAPAPHAEPKAEQNAAEIAALRGDLEALRRAMPPEGTVLRLADRAEQAEKVARDIAAHHESAQALLLVAGQLRDAVARGDSYEVELQAARRVAPADAKEPLDSLAPWAAAGVPRKDALVAEFPKLADDIVRATVAPAPDDSLWQRARYKLTTLVSIRRIDGEGDDTAAMVARAEAQLRTGDLNHAVQDLRALPEPSAQVASRWLREASARVTADHALSELSAEAAALSERPKG